MLYNTNKMALLLDLRSACRNLARSPGLVAVAVLSLALGIGANTAIFSLLHQVMLRSLPVADPERLMLLHIDGRLPGSYSTDNSASVFSYPMYRDLRDRSSFWSGLVARSGAAVALGYGVQTERVKADLVSGNFFEVLGVRPALGRLISPDDDRQWGAHPVVVLAHDIWVRRFGANPAVVAQKITLNGHPMILIGVAARGFRSIVAGQSPDLFTPIAMQQEITASPNAAENRRSRWLNLIGRLKPGVSRKQAERETAAIFRPLLEEEFRQMRLPDRIARRWLDVKPELRPAAQGINQLRQGLDGPLLALAAMVGFVLLIACFNVANLLLARAIGRQREIAVRLALGAGQGDLLRMVLVESSLLALAGAIVGMVSSRWILEGLLKLLPGGASGGWLHPQLDSRMLLFSGALAVATALLLGVIPALQTTRQDLTPSLKDHQSPTGSRRQRRWGAILAVGQMSLALVLLAGAGLFARSFSNLLHVDLGFRTENLFSFSLDLRLNGYDRPRGYAFLTELQRRLEGLPGIRSVAIVARTVLGHSTSNVTVEGYRAPDDEILYTSYNYVSPGCFRALGIPMIAGREFTDQDGSGSPKVAVVNELFARHFFGEASPIGRRMVFGGGDRVSLDMEIVGVVKNSKHSGLRDLMTRFVYVPYPQGDSLLPMTFYIRSYREESSIAGAVRALVKEMDSGLPVYNVRTMRATVESSIALEKLVAALAACFGVLATLLACLGLYGVIAYSVSRRTGEIGIRMALGARGGDVLRLVMRDVLALLGAGMAIGLPASLALGRLLRAQLFGVPVLDTVVLMTTVAALGISGMVAGFLPAVRATQIDPMRALRKE